MTGRSGAELGGVIPLLADEVVELGPLPRVARLAQPDLEFDQHVVGAVERLHHHRCVRVARIVGGLVVGGAGDFLRSFEIGQVVA